MYFYSEDPYKRVAFHQGLHCLLSTKRYSIFLSIFFKSSPDFPRYLQWTIPSLLYETRRKSLFIYKGLTQKGDLGRYLKKKCFFSVKDF